MNCKDAVLAIESRLDGEIEQAERLDLETHLTACAACRREVDDRRAFADQLGRSLYFALKSVSPMSTEKADCVDRMVDAGKRRVSWTRFITIPRVAAALILTIGLGAATVGLGLLDGPVSPQTRELAELQARRAAYDHRIHRVSGELQTLARDLDKKVNDSPKGALRDLGAMCVASTAAKLSGRKLEPVSADPRERVRQLAVQISAEDWNVRGRAVWGFRDLGRQHIVFLREALTTFGGRESDRAFAEMVLQNMEGNGDPVINIAVSVDSRDVTIQQFSNSTFRVIDQNPGSTRQVFEARNFFEFSSKFPHVMQQYELSGVDGDLYVCGAHLQGPSVRSTPFVRDVVWNSDIQLDRFLDGVTQEALLTDLIRSGLDSKEAVSRIKVLMPKIQQIDAKVGAVEVDPSQVKVQLKIARLMDADTVDKERKLIADQIANLESKLEEMNRQVVSLNKIRLALEKR